MAKIDGVQEVSLEVLKPYENNAKIHNAEQVERIAKSIKEFGFISPCLIDKDFNIIAGHGRVKAAQQLLRMQLKTHVGGNKMWVKFITKEGEENG